MIGSIKIYKPAKSASLVKSIIYKVNKVSSIVIRGTSTFFFFLKNTKPTKHTKIRTKTKSNNFLVTFVYFRLLLVT